MRFIKFAATCCALSIMTMTNGFAQERAAGSALDTQMTWSTLNDLVKAANDKSSAVNTRVDQIVVCGRKGRVYAPATGEADAQGCLDAKAADGTAITNINNTLNALTTSMNTLNATVANIIICNKKTQFYDGNVCLDIPPPKETEYVESAGWVGHSYTLSCTQGRKITAAMVNASRNPNQRPCDKLGNNCDGNATAGLKGQSKWNVTVNSGYVSAFIECK